MVSMYTLPNVAHECAVMIVDAGQGSGWWQRCGWEGVAQQAGTHLLAGTKS